jgi:DNA replication protein DnaC
VAALAGGPCGPEARPAGRRGAQPLAHKAPGRSHPHRRCPAQCADFRGQRTTESPPFALGNGWYIRRRCVCEQRVEEARQREATPRTLAQALTQAQLEQTYTWLGRSWVEQELEAHTFASFKQARQLNAYKQALAFSQHAEGALALYGTFGLGKTHLLAAIANARRMAGRACLFASAVTLFDAIQDLLGQDRDYHDLLKRAISTPLLVLDDIDKPKPSEFRQEMYYQIIDGRTRRRLPMAISSNGSPTEPERHVGGAARSRLMMKLIPVQMSGRDYRLEGKLT